MTMKNYLREKDKILKKIITPIKNNLELLKFYGFKINSYGYGGRDDDYVQINLHIDHSNIYLNIAFWTSILHYDENNIRHDRSLINNK